MNLLCVEIGKARDFLLLLSTLKPKMSQILCIDFFSVKANKVMKMVSFKIPQLRGA